MNKLKWRVFFRSQFFLLSMVAIVAALWIGANEFMTATLPAYNKLHSVQGPDLSEGLDYQLAEALFPFSITLIVVMFLLVSALVALNVKRFLNIKNEV
ncbi:MAG TPA: hypothetical protein PKJ63_01445 [Cyclobacteriaceae bacterium]|nr:hypothetical protein [Cyclobacteriaceae bacterium]